MRRFTRSRGFAVVAGTALISGAVLVPSAAFAASPLCSISNDLNADYEWLTSISVAGTTFEPQIGPSGYEDATTVNPAVAPIAIEPGKTYSVSLGVETLVDDGGGQTWVETAALWIDYNGNGTLDANEKVFAPTGSDIATWDHLDPLDPTSDYVKTFTGTFTVPANVASGKLWVRAMNYDDGLTDVLPCGDGDTLEASAVDFQVVTPAALPDTGLDARTIGLAGLGALILGSLAAVTAGLRRRA